MKYLAALIFILAPALCSAFCFEDAARENSLSPELLKSIAQVESGMDQKAVNKNRNGSTDLGLMQINTFWIKPLNLDRERLLSDACYNTKTGAGILKKCIDRHGYTWKAVGCYNAVSEPKQQAYSWKIYNALIREQKKPVPHEAGQEKPIAGQQNSSLIFSARDSMSDEMRSTTGNKPAAEDN
ncbi:MAG: lytic transglycosylase domain-containing protein [Nitrospiraceae bacterium]|nr:lytic transglycosylase domain-containing protein [Nitrospiraceae bacterium]